MAKKNNDGFTYAYSVIVVVGFALMIGFGRDTKADWFRAGWDAFRTGKGRRPRVGNWQDLAWREGYNAAKKEWGVSRAWDPQVKYALPPGSTVFQEHTP